MASEAKREGSAIAYVLMFLLVFACGPVLIWAMLGPFMALFDGYGVAQALIGVLALFLALCFITLAGMFLPKRDIENYRTPSGDYAIPTRWIFALLGPLVTGLLLIGAPILAPLMVLGFVYAIMSDPSGMLDHAFPAIQEWSLENLVSALQTIGDIPAMIGVCIWFLAMPLLIPSLWRVFRRQLDLLQRPALVIDAHGLVDPHDGKIIPWSAIAGAEVPEFTSIRLIGGRDLETLKPKLPWVTPKDVVEVIEKPGMPISVATLPIRASDLARIVRARCRG